MQLRTPDPRSSARPGRSDRVLVVNENSVERDEAVRVLQAGGIDAVGVDCPNGAIAGRFDVVVVTTVPGEDLLELVRSVRDRQLASSRQSPDGSLMGPGGLQLWPRAREARLNGKSVSLSPKESDVLRVLLERQNDVLSTDDIAVAVWGYETFGSPNFVEAPISRLRSKLTVIGAAEAIQTIRGEGYVIADVLGA